MNNRQGRHYNKKKDDSGEIIGVKSVRNKSKGTLVIVTKRRKLISPKPTKQFRKVLIAKRKLLPTTINTFSTTALLSSNVPYNTLELKQTTPSDVDADILTTTEDSDVKTESVDEESSDYDEMNGDEYVEISNENILKNDTEPNNQEELVNENYLEDDEYEDFLEDNAENENDENAYDDANTEEAENENQKTNNSHNLKNDNENNHTEDNEGIKNLKVDQKEPKEIKTDEIKYNFNKSNNKEIIEEEHKNKQQSIENPINIDELYESFTESSEEGTTQNSNNLSDYEPFFPELSEPIDAPVLLLKTTVIPTVEYETKTVVQTRLRTFTFLVTRINGDEKMTTSTTEIKPQAKTVTVTEPRTTFTTLTLLDWEATNVLPYIPLTNSVDNPSQSKISKENEAKLFEEARHNLATRVMSNGVEVIVASDKTTLPGEPDVRRILPSSIYKPITLKPSTLSNHMSLSVPQDASQIQSLSASLHSNPFVTKTCLTTFTYLTTYLQNGSTTVSSHEQVVSNIATEERNSAKISPTSSAGVTLTQHPNLAVGIFQTTYTYLNTILDGEQPLVVSSKHVVSNTVTAPDDYLLLLKPSEKATPVRETNTYYTTLPLEKTLKDGEDTRVISTDETLTQVIITQSIPPRSTSVMTSYIALDEDNNNGTYTTTDVIKTYYVTYTYFNTEIENDTPVVKTNVAISSDIVTEKMYVSSQKTSNNYPVNPMKTAVPLSEVDIFATKTYITTYTYYTTLLQNDKNQSTSIIVKSHTKEVENVVTETIDPKILRPENLDIISSELEKGLNSVIQTAILNNGQKLEITAIHNSIKPTKVLPIEKTKMPSSHLDINLSSEQSRPNIITGSTIVFFNEDDDPFKMVSKKATPTLKNKIKATKTTVKNELNSLLSSEIVKSTKISTVVNRQSIKKTKTEKRPSVIPTSNNQDNKDNNISNLNSILTEPSKKKTDAQVPKPANNIPDLLGFGSINVDTLSALTPVINAMAGLIKTNIINNKKNESSLSASENHPVVLIKERHKEINKEVAEESQNKPIYIPLQSVDEDSLVIAESQNIATFHIKQWEKTKPETLKNQKESPLLNGGIPISPGEIITANSDVIVGKPGRIGPRVPPISPNNPIKDEVPIGMRPPPPSHSSRPNHPKQHLKEQMPLPSGSFKHERPYFEKETYLRPPTPITVPLRPTGNVREEMPKLPLRNQQKKNSHGIPIRFVNQPQSHLNQEKNIRNKTDISIQPSAIDELIVLPEIIERSSSQPLLVNLQPSQVAYINIPHNRSTAFIYGGSTEAHVNGQYFDEPSPYTQQEFALPNSDSYNNVANMKIENMVQNNIRSPDQRRVVGVMTVGGDIINVNPSSSISVGHSHKIQPSKPQNVNINVPPLSFGMIQQGGDVNGHVFNHQESMSFNPPPINLDILPSNENKKLINSQNYESNVKNRDNVVSSNYRHNGFGSHIRNKPNKYNYRINPSNEVNNNRHPSFVFQKKTNKPNIQQKIPPSPLEFMSPPSLQNQQTTSKISRKPIISDSLSLTPPNRPEDESYDDLLDSYNENGEYLQESNNRPRYPVEIPSEIIKFNNSKSKLPLQEQNHSFQTTFIQFQKEADKNSAKASNIPFVRPENQLTNQIVKAEDASIIFSNSAQDTSQHLLYPENQVNYHSSASKGNTSTTSYLNTAERFPSPTENNVRYTSTEKTTYNPNQDVQSTTGSPFRNKEFSGNLPFIKSENIKYNSAAENRPKVTSMPVNPASMQKDDINRKIQMDTQTEKSFNLNILNTENKNRTRDKINKFEDNNKKVIISPEDAVSNMERLKPPPLPASNPSLNRKPPKINKYGEKPYPFDFIISSSPRPFTRNPTVGVSRVTEKIIGMNPPAVTTFKIPLKNNSFLNKYEGSFIVPTESSQNPNKNKYSSTVRPRRPFNRRRTTSTTTSESITRKRTTTPILTTADSYNNYGTIKETNYNLRPVFRNKTSNSHIQSLKPLTTENSIIENSPSTQADVKNETPHTTVKSIEKQKINSPKRYYNFTLHKTQNKQSTTPFMEPTKLSSSMHEETYIQTFTTTTIRSTIVKTLSGPATTSTLLVTKTEKFTVVDTITKYQTLVKPTSIYETVTTTVRPKPTESYSPGISHSSNRPINPTSVQEVTSSTLISSSTEDNLEDFIIRDINEPPFKENNTDLENNDSIFVVMTDKNKGSVINIPDTETHHRDDSVVNNEVNHILLGGVLIATPPNVDHQDSTTVKTLQNKCIPECQAPKNEFCQRVEGVMRCVCRPGFARMFPDRPCKPTYTYRLKIVLERHGKQRLVYHKTLNNTNSTEFTKLSSIAHDGLDRMIMQSDLRDIYHGIQVENYEPLEEQQGIVTNFYLQLSENTNDNRLKDILKKYLRSNNYSIGGTELYAAREGVENLDANDFDECSNRDFHDCSENAYCFNLPGTYTCSCKEGFSDLSENIVYPGRICSAELIGCERCNYHGTCYSRGDDQIICQCFHWYAGDSCHINLKVLLIALITLGGLLFILLIVCLILTCSKGKRRQKSAFATGMSFMPQRVAMQDNRRITLERRAMIQDTSSESGQSDTLPYEVKKPRKVSKAVLKKPFPVSALEHHSDNNTLPSNHDQKDRSLPVMIPRAKYHSAPPTSSAVNPETCDNRKNSVVSSNEAKLLSYLDAGPSPNAKSDGKRKFSNTLNEMYLPETVVPRKPSAGALVSAGFEVSATVNINNVNTLGTLDTIGGTEADRSENATLIQKISADFLSSCGSKSQFNTLRDDFGEPDNEDSLTNWLEITPKVAKTVSEARSCDETTIQPPTKSLRGGYDLNQCNDEANTMAERDVGSTFLLPHTHLYKSDRASDISGFDSL